MTEVKVCGVRRIEDAVACVEAGVDAVGINFWSGTSRCCDLDTARRIAAAVGGAAQLVAVVVDESLERIRHIRSATGIEWIQLHGSEPPELLEALLPTAYKALRVAGPEVAEWAQRYPGPDLLLDASVPGQVGGTGRSFDWDLAIELARSRRLTLAGGLHPDNVAEAAARVRPHRVDVASGVEREPGVKDAARIRAFVQAARRA